MRLGQFISVASGFVPSVAPTPPVAGAWDLTYASFTSGSPLGLFTETNATWPRRVTLSDDGTKMYILDTFWDEIYQYNLTTAGEISTAVFDATFGVGAQVTSLNDLVFKSDGTKMYAVDRAAGGSGGVYEYNLSTAWDVSTATYASKSLISPYIQPTSVTFKSDGTEVTLFMSGLAMRFALSTAWDISTATFDGTIGATGAFTPTTTPQGVFFKPDGTKMFIVKTSGDDVGEYTLSTAWDLTTASFVRDFYIGTQEASPQDLFFRDDGLKMYVVGSANNNVYEYTLSTAWDVSSASFAQSFSVVTQEGYTTGLTFKPDGTKMYVTGWNSDSVNEYDLSTAWDISTASFLQAFSVLSQESLVMGVTFKSDGTVMYVCGYTGDGIDAYTLSTAWDVSTATFSAFSSLVLPGASSPEGIFFDSTGTKLYVANSANPFVGVAGHTLSTAWDVSTLSFDLSGGILASDLGAFTKITPDGNYVVYKNNSSIFYRKELPTAWDITIVSGFKSEVLGVAGIPDAFAISPNGNRIITIFDPTLVSYSMTGGTWDIDTATWDGPTQNYYSVSSQEATPLGVFFKGDGLKMYVIGATGDDINEYDLGTAWDVTTATFLQNASIYAQEISPYGLFFKPDGTKAYVIGQSGDDVNEYNLSTAWDISTLTFVQSFLVSSTSPKGVYFRDDGLRMYAVGGGSSSAEVMQHTLSTAWDVSTATETYSLNLYFAPNYDTAYPTGVFFKPDGMKMFLSHDGGGYLKVTEWDLTTAWDISTATKVDDFDVSPYMISSIGGLFFKPDGTQMALVTYSLDAVYTFDVRE